MIASNKKKKKNDLYIYDIETNIFNPLNQILFFLCDNNCGKMCHFCSHQYFLNIGS